MRNRILVLILSITVLGLFIALILLLTNKSDGSNITSKVSKHMLLPDGEPVVAQVTDRDKLQSSIKKIAEKGDYVLLYNDVQKIIVYRPSIDKVIDVQPVLFGKQANPNLNVTAAIYDGSGGKNIDDFVRRLYVSYPNIRLIVKENAPREFPSTIVFTKTEGSSLASELAQNLEIKAGFAPEGVSGDNADVTFIVGKSDAKSP